MVDGTLQYGNFVKVRAGSGFRPGQDGMVMSAQDGDGNVGMLFCRDRYGDPVRGVYSEGIELWHVDELDMVSAER